MKEKGEEQRMIAYEFYCRDEEKGDDLIGILPERRQNHERITQQSVVNWLRTVMGPTADTDKIYFVRVKV